MSFSLNEVARLQLFGGAVWAKYERLLGEADRSAHGSLAQQELGAFCQAWLQDSNKAADEARTEAAAAALSEQGEQ
jgi:hypothetical protein